EILPLLRQLNFTIKPETTPRGLDLGESNTDASRLICPCEKIYDIPVAPLHLKSWHIELDIKANPGTSLFNGNTDRIRVIGRKLNLRSIPVSHTQFPSRSPSVFIHIATKNPFTRPCRLAESSHWSTASRGEVSIW